MKKLRILLAIAVIIFVLLFAYGSSLRHKCTSIGDCTACWQMIPITVTSDLCLGSDANHNESCTAEPYLQQHNAIVDVLLCACDKAEAANYADFDLNGRIEEVVKLHLNYTMGSYTLCNDAGITLTKLTYA